MGLQAKAGQGPIEKKEEWFSVQGLGFRSDKAETRGTQKAKQHIQLLVQLLLMRFSHLLLAKSKSPSPTCEALKPSIA